MPSKTFHGMCFSPSHRSILLPRRWIISHKLFRGHGSACVMVRRWRQDCVCVCFGFFFLFSFLPTIIKKRGEGSGKISAQPSARTNTIRPSESQLSSSLPSVPEWCVLHVNQNTQSTRCSMSVCLCVFVCARVLWPVQQLHLLRDICSNRPTLSSCHVVHLLLSLSGAQSHTLCSCRRREKGWKWRRSTLTSCLCTLFFLHQENKRRADEATAASFLPTVCDFLSILFFCEVGVGRGWRVWIKGLKTARRETDLKGNIWNI